MKLYPTHWTFVDTITVDTFTICFIGKDNLAPRRSSSSVGGSTNVHQLGGPWGMRRLSKITSHQRSSRTTGAEVLVAVDKCHFTIGRALKYL
jgi:hypothetical protein